MLNSIQLTAPLIDALAPLLDEEILEMHIESLEEMQDFVIAKGDDNSAPQCLDRLRFIRNIKGALVHIHDAIIQAKEGGAQ